MKFTTDVVIGIEIHVQLKTDTKLFCSCATSGNDEPNTRCCPVCLGHPGARPVLNKKALDSGIKLALALGGSLSTELVFSRKSYFYPDMSKNFQITQFEQPLSFAGQVTLGSGKIVHLTRIHLEEDPASITYPNNMHMSPYCFIDYNRAGNPLVEIVTEPELYSPQEARDFLNQLISILNYLEIFDPQTCIIKADANISLKESGYTRVEIKNITGFKELERALTYEITRQRALLRRGLKVERETRGWNDVSRSTKKMRSKETEADYGYIIEPDLCIVDMTQEMVDVLQNEIPELAQQKSERFVTQYGIDPVDAQVLSMDPALADLFESVVKNVDPVLGARWIRRELLRVLNYNKKGIADVGFSSEQLAGLLTLVEEKKISETTGQRLMERLVEEPFDPVQVVESEGLLQINNTLEIEEICKQVISEHTKAVADYHFGEEKSFHFLVGQVMRITKGKAKPSVVNDVMKDLLGKS